MGHPVCEDLKHVEEDITTHGLGETRTGAQSLSHSGPGVRILRRYPNPNPQPFQKCYDKQMILLILSKLCSFQPDTFDSVSQDRFEQINLLFPLYFLLLYFSSNYFSCILYMKHEKKLSCLLT